MNLPTGVRRNVRRALAKLPAVDRAIRRVRRTTALCDLQAEVHSFRAALAASEAERIAVRPSVAPFLTWVPPGHFYSPVPDIADIETRADELCAVDREPPGVDLRTGDQLRLFRELAALAREAPFAEVPGTAGRFGLDNPNYGVGDASMLQSMLRLLRPRRYLEVGSGYTTALALDVNERFLGGSMKVTAIEPFPELLGRLTRPGDDVEVLAQPVQSVPIERFRELEEHDVLFIDSSHVLKTGSDVQFLYTRVLPVLGPGVHVHVHDIFWPFEYLRHWWLEIGRAWNEAYVLHAFLALNDQFEIVVWNHYLAKRYESVIADELPVMLENTGGALWMRRRQSS